MGEIRVWIASLDLEAEPAERLSRLLSDDEQKRAARFHGRRDAVRRHLEAACTHQRTGGTAYRRAGTDHLFMANHAGTRYIDASREPVSYFRRFIADVRDRTETAMTQEHVFTVCELALEAQARAVSAVARPAA